jgi:outer membrane lipoprotein SlyB
MLNRFSLASLLGAALASFATAAWAQTTVNYGRITAVNLMTEESRAAQTGGAILGGALGAASGSNRSSGTRALRAGAGVFAGQQLGRIATQRQAFQYTILIDGRTTVTMVTDEAGLRVGDCVAGERGAFNNLRH